MGKRHDLTGRRFTRLTVISRSHTDPKTGDIWWNCLCDCGTEKAIRAYTLLRQTTRSCGCLRSEINKARRTTEGTDAERRRAAVNRSYAKHIERNREKKRAAYQANKHWLYVRHHRLAKQQAEATRPKPECCEVCNDDKGKIAFDHCHQSGRFRGWLCMHCNAALGHVRDDPDRLRKLIAYLEQARS